MALTREVEDLKVRIANADAEIQFLREHIIKLSKLGGDVRNALSRLSELERIQQSRINVLYAIAPNEITSAA